MRTVVGLLLAVVCLCSPVVAQLATPEMLKPENRTVSNTRQFTVFGGTRGERSGLVRRAEELKTGLLRELQMSDAWKMPVLIILTPGDGVRLRQAPVLVQVFDAGEAGGKIQIDLAPGAMADAAAVDRGILHALLLEQSLRKQKFERGRFVEPPDWLSAALTALLRRDASRDAALYAGLLEAKGMPRPDRFLRQSAGALRGRAGELYAAQSLALYNGLVELPDGRQRVIDNLTLAEPARDPVQRFAQTWPELAGDQAKLARLWALAVARLSIPKKMEFMTSEETGKKLRGILRQLDTSAEGDAAGEALVALSRKDEGRFRLAQAAQDTQRLSLRSHPLYTPLVEQYREMLDSLARNRRGGFERRYRETEDLRRALDRRCAEITDYMNWYQANKDDGEAGTAAISRPVPAEAATRRNDRISRYLDSVEQRGW